MGHHPPWHDGGTGPPRRPFPPWRVWYSRSHHPSQGGDMAQATMGAQPRRQPFPIAPYLYLAPTLIALFLFTILPSLYTIYISFTNYSLTHPGTANKPIEFV